MEVAGPRSANSIIRKINEACLVLERHPYGGPPRAEIRPAAVEPGNPRVVFYRLTENDIAEIVRDIDGRRDIDEIFAGAEGT